TEAGLMKLAASILKISESTDSSFSGGKRDLEEDDDRSFPLIHGRKPWVYGPVASRGGGRGGRGRQDILRGQRGGQRGRLGRGLPGPQTGGYNSYGGFGGSKR
ncbi:MAG: hypothetical protein ACK56F_15665, partial [bacterium]